MKIALRPAILVTLGVLSLASCGTNALPKNSTTGNNNGQAIIPGGGDGTTTPAIVSRVPAGPSGALTGNMDLTGDQSNLATEVVRAIPVLVGPEGINALFAALNDNNAAIRDYLATGTYYCEAGGTYVINSSGGDVDYDGLYVKSHVDFNDCGFYVGRAKLTLDGVLDVEDKDPTDNRGGFFAGGDVLITGQGSTDILGAELDLNGSADLEIGLEVTRSASSYDVAFGVGLDVDGKSLDLRLDSKYSPDDFNNLWAGGDLDVSAKLGYSEPGEDAVVGLSSSGLAYTGNCWVGTMTLTDGVHSQVITPNGACGPV